MSLSGDLHEGEIRYLGRECGLKLGHGCLVCLTSKRHQRWDHFVL